MQRGKCSYDSLLQTIKSWVSLQSALIIFWADQKEQKYLREREVQCCSQQAVMDTNLKLVPVLHTTVLEDHAWTLRPERHESWRIQNPEFWRHGLKDKQGSSRLNGASPTVPILALQQPDPEPSLNGKDQPSVTLAFNRLSTDHLPGLESERTRAMLYVPAESLPLKSKWLETFLLSTLISDSRGLEDYNPGASQGSI